MDEDAYRATYGELAANRCVFEKALTNNRCRCPYSQHFWLADREGYACNSPENTAICSEFLEKLREKSRFVLRLQQVGEPLPHNMEIRVQTGGMQGLASLLDGESVHEIVENIASILSRSIDRYDGLDGIPYGDLVQTIASMKVRKRRRSKDESETDG